MRTTGYFRRIRRRPDRAAISDDWIVSAIDSPIHIEVQADGRERRWVYIPDERKYLRVIVLSDGKTVHNAFFDRGFSP